jgi:hypothetical protein
MRGRARELRLVVACVVAAATASCATTRDGCPLVIDGACVSPREIDAYCGARSVGASCVAPKCAPGDAIDLRESVCVPQRTVRAIVARDRPSPLPETTVVACRDDHVLVAHGDHALCLARADACPRTTHAGPDPARRGCVADPTCPRGEIRARDACVRVVTNGVLDVGAWTRAVLGPDGGAGDDRLCRVLAQAPWDLDVGPGGSRTVALTVDLTFPNNDVTQVSATATPSATVQAALDSLLLPLRTLGGTADAASATTHVSCTIHGSSSPLLLPP